MLSLSILIVAGAAVIATLFATCAALLHAQSKAEAQRAAEQMGLPTARELNEVRRIALRARGIRC